MDLVIPVTQTAGYRPMYNPQPSMYPQPVMQPMMATQVPQPMYSQPMYPQPSLTPNIIAPYQSPMNNYALTPIISNDNRALHNLSNRLNETRDINEYSNKGLSEDNMRTIGEMIDKRVTQAIRDSPEFKNSLKDDIKNINTPDEEINEEVSEEKDEVKEETESETEENIEDEAKRTKKQTKRTKKKSRRITKRRSKHRKKIKRGKRRSKMRVRKSLLRNNIVVAKSDEELNKLQEFYFDKKIETSKIPTTIKRKIIPSLEIQKHKYYLDSLSESDRQLVDKFMNNKEFNRELHQYVRDELTDNSDLQNKIDRLNSIIKAAPKLSRSIIVFKDISNHTKLKKNNIYTESSIGVARFNPVPSSKGDTDTLSIKIPKLYKCLILSKGNIFDSGEILMPLSSKFKINNIKNININNNNQHILYQSALQ